MRLIAMGCGSDGNPGSGAPFQRGGGAAHRRALDALARRGRLRRLEPRTGLDFSSNDFLGLAASPKLAAAASDAIARGVPVGAGGSRLLRGNHFEHEALEEEAARFFGAESALYFGGGFPANAALLATLPMRGDLVVHDELVHASAHEGMGLTKAECVSVRHNDPQAVADAIRSWRAAGGVGRPWIAVESLYSMDGDIAPLGDLSAVADTHEAMLLVDEAHATGVLGGGGRGLSAPFEGRSNVVCLHTCGKALGAHGAIVTGPAVIRDFLINRARTFIYATAPSPLVAAIVRAALGLVASEPWRRTLLADRVALAGRLLTERCGLAPSGTHIQPVIVGSDARATRLAHRLIEAGYDIRAIRPPTVPEGTARVRISLTLNVAEAEIDSMVDTLARELAAMGGLDTAVGTAAPAHGGGGAASRPLATRVPTARSQPALGQKHGASVAGAATASEPQLRFVITGTDTNVGKTVFAAGLVSVLDGDYWKPIQSGLDGASDTETVATLSGLPRGHFHPEAYRLSLPLAPFHAAMADDVTIDPARLVVPQTGRPLVVEGAGGLMVPLTPTLYLADVLASWRFPVILVARTALGTINHTLLSIEALRSRGILIAGVAFVGPQDLRAETFIEGRGGIPVLGRLSILPRLDRDSLRTAFATSFDLSLLPGLGPRPGTHDRAPHGGPKAPP